MNPAKASTDFSYCSWFLKYLPFKNSNFASIFLEVFSSFILFSDFFMIS